MVGKVNQVMVNKDDLDLIVDIALLWAGEYGFRSPDRATQVIEACERLAPEIVKEWEDD